MGYRLEVSNRFNYGHSSFKCGSLGEVKKILDSHVFDGTLTLYEEKEINIPYEYSTLKDYKLKDDTFGDFYSKALYRDACINKSHCIEKEKKS